MAESKNTEKKDNPPTPYQAPSRSETEHTGVFGRKRLNYKAVADWAIIRKDGRPQAEIFFTYYSLKEKNKRKRPIAFFFNGGPGAASGYLQFGAAGPIRMAMNSDGTYSGPPVQLIDNGESWLPFTDLVFIDPVGTGFSRAVEESRNEREPFRYDKGEKDDSSKLFERADTERKDFFRMRRDLDAISECITKILSTFNRWDSPVILVGESYGGFRVAKLMRLIQESWGIPLKAALLVSPAISISDRNYYDHGIASWIDSFPSLGLSAYFHKKSQGHRRGSTHDEVVKRLEDFSRTRYSHFLIAGDALSKKEQEKILIEIAGYLGLSEAFVRRKEGRIAFWNFVQELLRAEQKRCGIYDATTVGINPFPDRDWSPGPDPSEIVSGALTAAANIALRSLLGVKTDRTYTLLNYSAFTQWTNDEWKLFLTTQVDAVEEFRYGLAMNPFMQVMVAHGYHDLVTPYFASQRLIDQMKLTREQRQNIHLENYHGGHMFYFHDESRKRFSAAVEKVIV